MYGETGIRDAVTGLYTRDYFDEIIGRELERSRRHGITLSVLSVVLERKGTAPGSVEGVVSDEILAEAAKTLQLSVRETDSVFRWEADEFVVLLWEADAEATARKVHQLSAVFKPWRSGDGPVKEPIRVRIGAATHEADIVFPATLQAAREAARHMTRA